MNYYDLVNYLGCESDLGYRYSESNQFQDTNF